MAQRPQDYQGWPPQDSLISNDKKHVIQDNSFNKRGLNLSWTLSPRPLSVPCMESKGMASLLARVFIVMPSHFGDARAAVVVSHVLIEMWTT